MGWRAGSSILRIAAVVGALGLLVIPAVAWGLGPDGAALSAFAGAGVVFVVLIVGIIGISAVVAGNTSLSMFGAATVYVGQIILIVVALLALRNQEWMVGKAFALAAIAQVLSMQVAQVVGYLRGRHIITAQLPGDDESPAVADADPPAVADAGAASPGEAR